MTFDPFKYFCWRPGVSVSHRRQHEDEARFPQTPGPELLGGLGIRVWGLGFSMGATGVPLKGV